MPKHSSIIFYLVINLVICASRAADSNDVSDQLWRGEEEDVESNGDEMSMVNSLQPVGPWKFRRDLPYNDAPETNNNDDDVAGEGTSLFDSPTFDDARIRYILDNIQTRDVNKQTAATRPTTTDTPIGKLIPCFIH